MRLLRGVCAETLQEREGFAIRMLLWDGIKKEGGKTRD